MTASSRTAGTAAGPQERAISPNVIAFAAARGISQATLVAASVVSATVFFPELGRKAEAIVFRFDQGWKARAIDEKTHVTSKGFKLAFWHPGTKLPSGGTIYITEGELDACALVAAGLPIDDVLSVPNGARERPAEDPQDLRGYGYVETALRAGLSKVKRFVWCGDEDDAGHALRADMVRLLGAARFHFVTWPDGCKDACDMLRADGAQAVLDLVTKGALPWPVEGVYRLNELPEPAPLTLWRPGFPEWESRVLLAPRTLSAVTGQPGHGKTALMTQIWFQVTRDYGVPIAVASYETRAKPHIRRQLRTLYTGKLERDMDDAEIARADRWINDRYLFIVHPEQRPTIEWLLDMAEIAVARHGARVVVVDPWNRIEGSRTRDESETDYIGRCLRTLHGFAHDMNCHVQIIAHPAKSERGYRDRVPELEDISGSKHWDNMPDQGFVVHRPAMFDGVERKTEAMFYQRKARFEELGYPCKLAMNYRLDQGRFVSVDYELPAPRARRRRAPADGLTPED